MGISGGLLSFKNNSYLVAGGVVRDGTRVWLICCRFSCTFVFLFLFSFLCCFLRCETLHFARFQFELGRPIILVGDVANE